MMGKLSDIIGNFSTLEQQFQATAPAPEQREPVPAGKYMCAVEGRGFDQTARGTPYYQLVFRILEGPQAGRQVWHDLYLSEAALGITRRELSKLGITSLAQLEKEGLPAGLRAEVEVVVRTTDDGRAFNRVRRFTMLAPEKAPAPTPHPWDLEGGDGDDGR